MSTIQQLIPLPQPDYAMMQPHEWRSGQRARVKLRSAEFEGAEGRIRSVVDGAAWMEFEKDGTEFNARIPLERLAPVDDAVSAARDVMQREADKYGGVVVDTECACGGTISGHVVIDPGEISSSSGPGVHAHLYVAGYVRSCNCDTPRADIERELIITAATQSEDA